MTLGSFRILLASAFCLFSWWAKAQETPSGVIIRNVRLSGAGCDSSASAVVSGDAKSLSILFDNYMLEIGQGSSRPTATSAQKDCLVQIDLEVPTGWTYNFDAIDYRGFAALPASAWAFHRFSVQAPNMPISSMREAMVNGPNNQNYFVSIKQKPGRLPWSACNQRIQTVTLLSQLGVSYFPRTTDRTMATISLDSTDLSLSQSLKMIWKRCSR